MSRSNSSRSKDISKSLPVLINCIDDGLFIIRDNTDFQQVDTQFRKTFAEERQIGVTGAPGEDFITYDNNCSSTHLGYNAVLKYPLHYVTKCHTRVDDVNCYNQKCSLTNKNMIQNLKYLLLIRLFAIGGQVLAFFSCSIFFPSGCPSCPSAL